MEKEQEEGPALDLGVTEENGTPGRIREYRSIIGTNQETVGILDSSGVLHCLVGDFEPSNGPIDTPILDVSRPDCPGAVQEFINTVLHDKKPMSRTFHFPSEIGEETEYTMSFWPSDPSDDHNIGFIVVRNLSWERATLSGLIETEERFQTIMDGVRTGILFTDLDGRILDINPAFQELTGYSKDHLVSTKFTDFLVLSGEEGIEFPPKDLDRKKKVVSCFVTECKRKDGILIWCRTTLILNASPWNGPSYFTVLVEDITELVETENERAHKLLLEKKVSELIRMMTKVDVKNAAEITGIIIDFLPTVFHASAVFIYLQGKDGAVEQSHHWISERLYRLMDEHDPPIKNPGKKILEAIIDHEECALSLDIDVEKNPTVTFAVSIGRLRGTCLLTFLDLSGTRRGFLCLFDLSEHGLWQMEDIINLKKIGEIFSLATHVIEWRDVGSFFFEHSSDLFCMLDSDKGRTVFMNPAFERLLSIDADELVHHPFKDLLHPSDRTRFEYHIGKMSKSKSSTDINRLMLLTKNMDVRWVNMECWASPTLSSIICIGRDVTEKFKADLEIKKSKLPFHIKDGHVYLEKKRESYPLFKTVQELIEMGYNGFIFSRNPDLIIKSCGHGSLRHYWLAERGGKTSISPSIQAIKEILIDIPKESLILIDGFEHIILINGFEKAMQLLQLIREVSYLNGHISLISIDPDTITNQQLCILEKECLEIGSFDTIRLTAELDELLRLANDLNTAGKAMSYQDAQRGLGISKPTARKRILELVKMGYLKEKPRGRKKYFDITNEVLGKL